MERPQVTLFDPKAQGLRHARARRRQSRNVPFLLSRALDDLRERLLDVNRAFARACLIGPFDWRDAIVATLPDDKRFKSFHWREEPDGTDYDLVISLLHVQSLDAVGEWMRGARAMLVPDGLFMACLIGGESLGELRRALYTIDTDAFGAPTPRIHPMIDLRAAAQLLAHAGLAIPVTDSDRFRADYRRIETLISDLRDLGLTNVLNDRDKRPLPKMLQRLDDHLRPDDGEPVPVTWELVWMSGWAPHESQQKPLARGSAKIGLNDALKAIRDGSS